MEDRTENKTRSRIDYSQYKLKWEEQFEGNSLNRDDWNVELHEPGWVNEELQEYVDSEENIYIRDGKLEIRPIQIKNADGTYSYTSGRITTQNKHDYIYGLFEARVKVPAGKGYLPAFWMMPADEDFYGQWPRCGEIDIMEIMGQETNKAYNTIHYGNPHKENQGTYVLEEGRGTFPYPAPFDQPFHVILNLAVGGNWVTYPVDETFESRNYSVDYVKIWQKE